MTQFFLTILFSTFVVFLIVNTIVLTVLSLVNKSLLCAKIYTFIFEYDDWLLYKRAKKQGIQHYLNGHHFSQFCEAWNKVKDEYGVKNNYSKYLELGQETKETLLVKYNELKEKYYYKEYNESSIIITDDDIVLKSNMYDDRLLYICCNEGSECKKILSLKPMVKDVIKSQITKDRIFYELLADPKMVVSF